MTRCVALLRGINVGKAKRVAMADLRALVEGLGYRDVRTVLNSGNVVFTAPGATKNAASRIEGAIASTLKLESRVFVLTADEVAATLAKNPLGKSAADPSRTFVTILADAACRKRLDPLTQEDWTPERIVLGAHAAYMWCPAGMSGGKLAEALSRALRDGGTTRNWATMSRLHALTRA